LVCSVSPFQHAKYDLFFTTFGKIPDHLSVDWEKLLRRALTRDGTRRRRTKCGRDDLRVLRAFVRTELELLLAIETEEFLLSRHCPLEAF